MVEVLGISMYNRSIEEAIIMVNKSDGDNRCVSATGAHGLVYSKRNIDFKKILSAFYINLPDGMPSVWVGRLKGANMMSRCYGPDFFQGMMIHSSKGLIKHFLCGGTTGVADKLKLACQANFGNFNIVGTFCPPFSPVDKYDFEGIANKINESKADIVWVGLSTPKQEQFAFYLSKFTKVKYIITVGAAFDFHIGNVKQAPNWIQSIGMEWFFRLLMEPKRLWKRYFDIVPSFIYYNFAEIIKGEFFKK
mgnify:FL=1